jgi:hypothetical protein
MYELPIGKVGIAAVARFCMDLKIMTVEGFVVGQFVNIGGTLFDQRKTPEDPMFNFVFETMMKLFKVILHISGIYSILANVFCKYGSIIYAWSYIENAQKAKAFLEEMDNYRRDMRANFSAITKEGEFKLPEIAQTYRNMLSVLDHDKEKVVSTQVKWRSALITPTIDCGNSEVTFANPRRGDLICMFTGAKEPYVLRRRNDHYILMRSVQFDPVNLANLLTWKDCVREYTLGVLDLHKLTLYKHIELCCLCPKSIELNSILRR